MYQTINANITHDRMSVAERGVKRFADILCSLVGLIVLSPVFLLIIHHH